MAQYQTISAGNDLEITNNISTFRYQVRSGDLYLDQEITESVWGEVMRYSGEGLGEFRVGARIDSFVIDETLTLTGFSGDEDTDWINITKKKLS